MSDDFGKITSSVESIKDEQIAKFEGDLQNEKESRKVERFTWAIICIILFDGIIFRDAGWAGCLFLTLFEFILLIVFAKSCGVDDIYTTIRNAIDAVKQINFRPEQAPKTDDDAIKLPDAANIPSKPATLDDLELKP